MQILLIVLLVLALVLCGLRAFLVGHPRIHLGWLGVTAALLAWLLGHLPL